MSDEDDQPGEFRLQTDRGPMLVAAPDIETACRYATQDGYRPAMGGDRPIRVGATGGASEAEPAPQVLDVPATTVPPPVAS